MTYFIIILLLAISVASIWYFPVFKYCALDRRLWLGAWLLKLLAMMAVFALYEYHYTDRSRADVFRYYDDGVILNEVAKDHPKAYAKLLIGPVDKDPLFLEYLADTYNFDQQQQSVILGSNDLIIKLHSLIHFLPGANYHVHAIVFNYLSLMGILLLYSTFLHYAPDKKYLLFAILLLLPSVLFWSSAPLKESLLLLGSGLLIKSVHLVLIHRQQFWALVFFIIGLFLTWNIRSYYALTLVPLLLLYFYMQLKQKKVLLHYFILIFIGISVFWEAGNLHPTLDFKGMLINKNHQFIELAETESAGSALPAPRLNEDLGSFIKALPHAIVNTSLRPFLWNINGPLYALMFLENLIWFGLLSLILFKSKLRIRHKNLFYLLLCIGFAILIINGMTVPILGALARYRSIGLLFILLAFANLEFDENKLFSFNLKKSTK